MAGDELRPDEKEFFTALTEDALVARCIVEENSMAIQAFKNNQKTINRRVFTGGDSGGVSLNKETWRGPRFGNHNMTICNYMQLC